MTIDAVDLFNCVTLAGWCFGRGQELAWMRGRPKILSPFRTFRSSVKFVLPIVARIYLISINVSPCGESCPVSCVCVVFLACHYESTTGTNLPIVFATKGFANFGSKL
ncbi:hypothetical protein VPH35_073361 [Triticum aestivum]